MRTTCHTLLVMHELIPSSHHRVVHVRRRSLISLNHRFIWSASLAISSKAISCIHCSNPITARDLREEISTLIGMLSRCRLLSQLAADKPELRLGHYHLKATVCFRNIVFHLMNRLPRELSLRLLQTLVKRRLHLVRGRFDSDWLVHDAQLSILPCRVAFLEYRDSLLVSHRTQSLQPFATHFHSFNTISSVIRRHSIHLVGTRVLLWVSWAMPLNLLSIDPAMWTVTCCS